MLANCCSKIRGLNLMGKTVLAFLAVCCVTDVYCLPTERGPSVYDTAARPVDLIRPGTVLGNQPPPGWSHLIIKSFPRTAAGDMNKVSQTSLEMSSLLFTAFLANVEAQQANNGLVRYRLGALGVGFGTRIRGQDTIVSPDSQRQLGANLGFVARQVLAAAYEKQQDDRIVARSETMALVDTPAYMLRGTRHRPVVLRYALLVDAQTGRLDPLLWLIDRDDRGNYVGPSSPVEWLPPNKIEDCILHVDANEFTLGVPSEGAFAILHIPRGQKEIPFPDDVKALAIQPRLSAAQANALETRLQKMTR